MKVLGIVGGIGPESTIDYYRQIIDLYRERQPDGSYPTILIYSMDAKRLIDAMAAQALPEVVQFLLGEVQTLARAGADFALIAANTPHIVFDEIQHQSPIPLLSIVEATCRATRNFGLKRVGLFGTRYTMQGHFYSDVFSREGIALLAPDPQEQDFIHDKYMNELFKGVFLPQTRDRLLRIVDRMKRDSGIEGLILGGTELPLILRDESGAGIPLLDTTKIHVAEAVARLLT